jgi:UMF1 family MFS transporter
MDKNKKAVWGWAMYDWANSAFATAVIVVFFPLFFKDYWSYGHNSVVSTAQLGFANSLASLFVAVMAPLLGAIADRGSTKKKFLIAFAYLGALMTAALFFVQKGNWTWAVFIFVMGNIGFAGANIFYDSLLLSVSRKDNIDYVSAFGYSMGYLGGGLLFAANVAMFLWPNSFGIADSTTAVRYSFVTVALWWGMFTILTIKWVPEEGPGKGSNTIGQVVAEGFGQFLTTFNKIRHLKTVILFLFAYWFYIDGVDTIQRMAIAYGRSIGFASSDLAVAVLLVQFVGFPAALIFGKLGQQWSARKSIFLAIGIYMFITLWGTMMTSKYEFYFLAFAIGLAQGGIQALSRSYYSRLIPADQAAEYYGFYNMLGKFAAIIGPSLMGVVGLVAGSLLTPPSPIPGQTEQIEHLATRWSMSSVLLLFLIGGILFYFVNEEKGKAEIRYLSRQ